MDNKAVILKSNKYGIIVILNDKIPFEDLLWEIAQKFNKAADFFKNAQMVITFEGRKLTQDEEKEIIDTITDNCKIQILCIIDTDKQTEEIHKKLIKEAKETKAETDGQFYKGTLRSGQVLETETSIIILGDVNPGANIVSKGNIIVLGTCKGRVHAGATGNKECFVAALDMKPMHIRIGDCQARSASARRNSDKDRPFRMDPKIAFVREDHIYLRPITKDVLGEISAANKGYL